MIEKMTEINLPASKSISNRLLILNYLSANKTMIQNLSRADDTILLEDVLHQLENEQDTYEFYLKNAGTTYRFLTALLSTKKGEFTLLCDERMKKRPIADLVEALCQLGAEIYYLEDEGFPPLKIIGKKLKGGKILISGAKSSQFISALLLITPTFEQKLELFLTDEPSSKPYIEMTLSLLDEFGVKSTFSDRKIVVESQKLKPPLSYTVEADWSAAAVWYAFVSLLPEKSFFLPDLKENSLQGDSELVDIYRHIGVETEFSEKGILIHKSSHKIVYFTSCMSNFPDLMPTVAVNLCLLGIGFRLSGLENLHIKESDRIKAITECLANFGYGVEEKMSGVLEWNGKRKKTSKNKLVKTHNDHRIAMACSLFLLTDEVEFDNENCVKKSYPDFWQELSKVIKGKV